MKTKGQELFERERPGQPPHSWANMTEESRAGWEAAAAGGYYFKGPPRSVPIDGSATVVTVGDASPTLDAPPVLRVDC